MTSPANTFPMLLQLGKYYMRKLNENQRQFYDILTTEIVTKLDAFPTHLDMIEQGEFDLGYYHENSVLYAKKTKDTDKASAAEVKTDGENNTDTQSVNKEEGEE